MRGPISRKEAEEELRLMRRGGGSFLVRESAKGDGYAISVLLDDGRLEHHKLAAGGDGVMMLNGNYMSVNARTVPEAVNHLYDALETLSQPLSRSAYSQLVPAGVINPAFHGAMSNPGYAVGQGPDNQAYDVPSFGTLMRGDYHLAAEADAAQ